MSVIDRLREERDEAKAEATGYYREYRRCSLLRADLQIERNRLLEERERLRIALEKAVEALMETHERTGSLAAYAVAKVGRHALEGES